MPNATRSAASQTLSVPAGAIKKKANRIFWQVSAAGFLTPVLVGIVVKYYLQLTGQPHLEWSDPGPIEPLLIPVIVSWIPFAVLAWVARSRVLRRGLVEKLVYGAFAGAEVGAIWTFLWGWQHIEALILAALFLLPVWVPIVAGMLIGCGIGRLGDMPRPAH